MNKWGLLLFLLIAISLTIGVIYIDIKLSKIMKNKEKKRKR